MEYNPLVLLVTFDAKNVGRRKEKNFFDPFFQFILHTHTTNQRTIIKERK